MANPTPATQRAASKLVPLTNDLSELRVINVEAVVVAPSNNRAGKAGDGADTPKPCYQFTFHATYGEEPAKMIFAALRDHKLRVTILVEPLVSVSE